MLHRVSLNSGIGTPVVFLHGFLGCTRDWERVAAGMQSPCIAVDLPGHGKSPFTADLEGALSTALPPEPVHLVGYSMGGRLALRYALAEPERVASLTLIGAHLGLKTEAERRARAERDAEWLHKLRTLSLEEFIAEWYKQAVFGSGEFEIPPWRYEQNVDGLASALEAFVLATQPDYSGRLPAGTRILVGEHDVKFRALYQGLPHQVIPKAGHAPHLENSEELAGCFLRISRHNPFF